MDRLISEQAVIDVINGCLINRQTVIDKIKAIPSKNTETQGDDRWLLHFGQNKAIPSAEPTLDSIRESIEEYVCNVETDTERAQKMLNAWRAIEYDELLPPAEPQVEQWKDFVLWVAKEIFDENWEYNKGAFGELACRKLAKMGIVKANGDKWELVEPMESEK